MMRVGAVSVFSMLVGSVLSSGCQEGPLGRGSPIHPSVGPAAHLVSGTVAELSSAGNAAVVDGAHVTAYLHQAPYFRTLGHMRTGADGRYAFAQVPDGIVLVFAYKEGDLQPCVATAIVSGDATIDVSLVPEHALISGSAWLPTREPTLAGTVFETSEDGLRPAAGARLYATVGGDTLIAETATRVDGRYSLCNLPPLFQVTVTKPGFAASGRDVELRANTVLDLEITRFD